MKIYLSLYYKSLMAIMAILLPVIIAFTITFHNNKENIKSHTLQDINIIADAYEGLVFQFIQLAKQRTEDFASDGFIRNELSEPTVDDKNRVQDLSWHLKNNKIPLDNMLSAIHAISLDGRIVATTDNPSYGLDVSEKDFFIRGSKSTTSLETSISGQRGKELFISAPIKHRKGGKVIGVLTNTIPIHKIGEVLSGDFFGKLGALTHGSKGRESLVSYLINQDGHIIASSKNWQRQITAKTVASGPITACQEEGKEHAGFYLSHTGKDVAGASMCLTEMKWTLLVEVDKSEVLHQVEKMKKDATLAASVMTILTGILFMLFNKVVVSPLRRISKAAREIAEGNYDAPLPASVTLFGTDEISRLTDSFNIMSKEIKQSTEAVRESERRLIKAQRIASIGNWSWEIESNELHWYDTVYDIFGMNKEEVQPSYELFMKAIHNNDRPIVESRIKEALEGKKTYSVDHRIILQDGTERFVHEEGEVEYDLQGNALRMVGTVQDISRRKQDEDEIEKGYYVQNILRAVLQNSMGELPLEKQFSDALDLMLSISWFSFHSKASIFLTEEVDGKETLSLKTYRGFSKEEVLTCKNLSFGTGCCGLAAQNSKILFTSSNEPCKELSKNAVGLYSCYCVPILSKDKVLGVVNIYLEPKHKENYSEREFLSSLANILAGIIERKRSEFELKKLSTAIEQSESIIFITSRSGNIEYVNSKFEKITGYSRDEILGQNSEILTSGETDEGHYPKLWKTVFSGDVWRGTFRNKNKKGGFYWADVTASPIMSEKGEVTSLLIIQEDITEKRESDARIHYLGTYDELTGLLNRSTFEEKVNDICRDINDKNGSGVLMLIDIDNMKFINDAFGHETGDKFIKLTSETLKLTAKKAYQSEDSDLEVLTCRLGADEFGVFIPNIDEKECLGIGHLMRENVANLHIKGISAKITISIGISISPAHGLAYMELMAKADAAIIMLRKKGRNDCAIYRKEDQVLEEMHFNLATKIRIQKTLDEDRFETWFQPILCLNTDTIKHYEVLVRMREEDGSILSPGVFINVAEMFGMIGLIDRIVAEKTMKKQAALSKEGKHITFSINLSGKDLGDEKLLSFLKEKIIETGADPSHIVFEITETEAIHDIKTAVKFISELKSIGCQFSLDDFGVGFTSFIYLKEMLVDFIKIDGSFIKNLCNSKDDQVVVKSIIDVAKGMGIKTVAEFVETQESLDLLRKWKIDYAQGYLVGKPAPDPKF